VTEASLYLKYAVASVPAFAGPRRHRSCRSRSFPRQLGLSP